MTTFAELETLVVAQTRRPEIPAITKAAIKSATLRAHHADFFPRDLSITRLNYTPLSTAVLYDFPNIHASLTRLRTIQHIEGIDAVTSTPVENLEYRTADDLYDADGNRRPSVYTLLGATLRLYPLQATGAVNVFFFQNPNVAEADYASWIADTYEEELAMWAAAIVFSRTGFVEMAAQYNETHIKPFKEMLINSHLLGNVS
jgi:hypothetical protein